MRAIMQILLFLMMPLLFATAAQAGDNSVDVVTLYGYPPYCFYENESQQIIEGGWETIPSGADAAMLRGFSWDVFREAMHEMGYAIRLKVYPWARAMETIKNGGADVIFPAGVNAERKAYFAFSSQPVNSTQFVVYVPENDPIRWRGLSSLAGKTIAVIRGFNYGDEWAAADGISKYEVSGILKGFKMLDRGRLDGFAGYEVNWDYALMRAEWKTRYRKLPFGAAREYVAGMKSNNRTLKILADFDTGLVAIREKGQLEAIARKWGQNPGGVR